MRVLHVTPAYYPATYWGGPIFSVHALNNALARLPDIELTVLTTDAAGLRPADRLEPADLLGLYPNQRVEIMPRLAGASVSLAMLGKLPAWPLLLCKLYLALFIARLERMEKDNHGTSAWQCKAVKP